jgi:hypothetical protein
MTADPIERRLLLARQGLTPSPQLSARVRARFGTSQQLPPAAAAARAGRSALRERWRALRASGSVGLAVGVGLFGVGCVVGLLGSELVLQPREAASSAAQHAAEVSTAPIGPASAAPPSDLGPAEPAAPLASAEPPSGRALAAPAPTVASTRQRAPVAEVAGVRSESRPPPRVAPPRDWRGELELLERAERAVRADQVALALTLLGDFDVRYPASRLVEERAAVETMAHCQAAATDGGLRAARFLKLYPSSLYRTRVEALCPSGAPVAADPSDKTPGAGH